MPAAIPLIVSVAVAAVGTSPVVGALIVGAASILAGMLTKQDMPKSKDSNIGMRINTRSTKDPLPIPYGRCRVWGNEVFIEASGADNNYLWIVQTLGEGECDSVYQIDGVGQVFLEEKLYNKYGGNVAWWFHSGTNTQTVDSSLHAKFSKWTDTLRGTCYIVFRLKHDLDYFQSLPARSVVLKGRKLYDPRTETTAWSDNAALVLYDYLTNQRYGRRWPTSVINTDSVKDAANYCQWKGWTFNKIIEEWNSQDAVDDILRHFRGGLIWSEGEYHFRYFDTNYESSVFTITDDHIYQDTSHAAQISITQPSRWAKPDGLSCSYTDASKQYTTDYLPIPAESGGGDVVDEIDLEGYLDKETTGKMGTYLLERSMLDRTIAGAFREDLWQLEPYDLVTLSSTTLGIEDQLLRTQSVSPSRESGIALSFVYEDEELYNDEFDTVLDDVYECILPDPFATPPGVINVTATEDIIDWRLRSATRLNVEFDPPENYPYYSHIEVWKSLDNENWDFVYPIYGYSFTLEDVEEKIPTWLRLKVVSIHGVKQADVDDYKLYYEVSGASAVVPASLAGLQAIVGGNVVNLYALQLENADIDQYEFRLGSSWTGSLFLMATKAPNYSLQGVKPGSHTFWVNTRSTNLQYGASAKSAVAAVIDPPDGWTVYDTDTDDFSTGTHNNTESFDYGGETYLRCKHIGATPINPDESAMLNPDESAAANPSALFGTYIGPTIDLGASGRYLVYIMADVAVTGGGTDWVSLAPNPTTWTDMGCLGKWSDIVQPPLGSTIEMKMNYGETTAFGNTTERMEILAAIMTGRYFRVEITITDPVFSVNGIVEHLTIKWCTI